MRAGRAGRGERAGRGGRARLHRRDKEPATLVEAVDCASSHISREPSLHDARQSKESTPRSHIKNTTPRTAKSSKESTPRTFRSQNTPHMHSKLHSSSPRIKNSWSSPNKVISLSSHPVKTAPSSVKSDHDIEETSPVQLAPVSKIQCCKKDKSDIKKDRGEGYKDIEKPKARGEKGTQDKKKEVSKETMKEQKDKPEVCKESRVKELKECRRKDNAESSYFARDQTARGSAREKKEDSEVADMAPAACDFTRVLKNQCAGDDGIRNRSERVSGARNAQLLCINAGSPQQSSTPLLLRILEETIQKKAPKHLYSQKQLPNWDLDRFRLTFNISDKTTERLFQYRTKFVQHMLTSSMYANSAVGKPWEMISNVSDQIIDELLSKCISEMELNKFITELYKSETR